MSTGTAAAVAALCSSAHAKVAPVSSSFWHCSAGSTVSDGHWLPAWTTLSGQLHLLGQVGLVKVQVVGKEMRKDGIFHHGWFCFFFGLLSTVQNYRGWDRGDRKHSFSPWILYLFFPLHALTAHVTTLRQGLPRAPRSLQPSPAEAFARCCYAYTNSQRLGLRTADTSLPPPPRVPLFQPLRAGPRGKLLLSRHTQPAPAVGQRRGARTAPLNSSCAAGGSTAGGAARRGAGAGAGCRCAAAGSAQPAPGGGSGSGAAVPRGGGEDEGGFCLLFLPPRDDFHSNLIERCNFGNWGGFIIIIIIFIFFPFFSPLLPSHLVGPRGVTGGR